LTDREGRPLPRGYSEPTCEAEKESVSPARATAAEDEYLGEHHVYEPHRAGLPPLVPYLRELWRRRGFAFELSRTSMHAANTDTVFGQLWLVINPLLLAGVYYLLTDLLGGGKHPPHFFATLTSGLFLYYFITGAMSAGTTSITQGGRLILNTSFPKMLLTVSTVYTAFRRYLPTLLVYAVIHIVVIGSITVNVLWMIPILVLSTMMGLGLANLFATLQVYFRDTASFLPYFVRIWLYVSPVLWVIPEKGEKVTRIEQTVMQYGWINPMFGPLAVQGQALVEGRMPSMHYLLYTAIWAVLLFVGGSLLMMSREREFAVRL
jgi:teichoic acid transport system permease protein